MTDEEYKKYSEALESELGEVKAKNHELSTNLSTATGPGVSQNLVEYQLETQEALEKIEHFLKGDMIFYNQETQEVSYKTNTNKDIILLNEYGVNFIMSILNGYFHKGVFLGNLEDQRIYGIMADIATEIRKFVFCNYEKMGMTTKAKVARFPSLLVQVFHMLEIALMRSEGGSEREIINTSNIVMQNQSMNPAGQYARPSEKRKFSVFSPSTW